MKIRTSFVTNSSSSSFIIAMKSGGFTPEMKEAMANFVMNMIEESTTDKITTIEELDEYYIREDYNSIEELKEDWPSRYEEYCQAKEAIERGETIYCGEVDDQDYYDIFGLFEDLFKKLEKTDGFTGIETEMGY